MEDLLLQTYEVIREIGAGGGGTVYLARHTRLDKLVVLKADHRKITSSPSLLRREVESLKNLHHQYIPSVYDFFIEEDTVFTVIDFIQGESFDKLLKQGRKFSQAEVIGWAKELLVALVYLHTQPPHGILHADIKPANIMLTPEGDIRLIDFNIALILGAEGAVSVGRSFGYASPEHYHNSKEVSPSQGRGRSSAFQSSGVQRRVAQPQENPETMLNPYTALNGETQWEDDSTDINSCETELEVPYVQELPGKISRLSKVTAKSLTDDGSVVLDCRSDIYSLGATLYHLFTGVKPSKNANEVKPMSGRGINKQVRNIIKKAMHPNPKKRYQTAKAMLKAFDSLHRKDAKSKTLNFLWFSGNVACVSAFLWGSYLNQIYMTRIEATQTAKVLAEYSANALAEGNVTLALDYALQSLPTPDGKFVPEYIAEGQFALSEALGLYEFNEGYQVVRNVTMDSEILGLDLTEDGKTAAVLTLGKCTLLEMETGDILAEIPTVHSALAEFFFVDDKTLFVAGENGVTLYDCETLTPLWTGELGTRLAVSGNGEYYASLYKDENYGFVYYKDGTLKKRVEFGDYNQRIAANDLFANPHDNLFAINNEGTLLALSFEGGGMWIFDSAYATEEEKEDFEFFDVSDFTEFSGGFYENYFAATCSGSDGTLFFIFDTNDWTQTGGFSLTNKIVSQVKNTGIYLQTDNIVVKIHPVTGEQEEIAYTGDSDVLSFSLAQDGHALVLTEDFGYSFFDPLTNLIEKKMEGDDGLRYGAISNESALMGSLDSNLLKILTLKNYPEQQFGSYDSYFEHLEARVTAEEDGLVLFNLEEIQVFDLGGSLLGSSEIPEDSGIYDQQFHREEGYLEVIYYDGTRSHYSAKNGAFIESISGAEPDYSLEEWFETKNYRIFSPLHGNPEVYDKNSETPDEVLKTIDVPDYLTYVTEIGELILLEFVSTDGARYGLLCDENLDKIAYLPNLTDYKDGYFYFDEGKGNIKREKIYSLDEMLDIAENKL